jgi:hypothetical protein
LSSLVVVRGNLHKCAEFGSSQVSCFINTLLAPTFAELILERISTSLLIPSVARNVDLQRIFLIESNTMAGGIAFIATLVVRFFQILFAIVVLGLSITMAKWQVFGKPPPTTEYGAFSGGFAFLVGLVGVAAVFVEAIPGLIMAGLDALAAILTLAAGIVSRSLPLLPSPSSSQAPIFISALTLCLRLMPLH